MDVVEPLRTDLLEEEVQTEDPDEMGMSEVFRAASLEDFLGTDNMDGTASVPSLIDPRSEAGAGELDKLGRGEDERDKVAASVLFRAK